MTWYILRVSPNRERITARILSEQGIVTWLPVQIVPVRPHISRRRSDMAHLRRIAERLIYPCAVFVQAEFVPQIGHLVRQEDRWQQSPSGDLWAIPDHQIRLWALEIEHLNETAKVLGKITAKAKRRWKQLHEALAELKDGKAEMDEAA